MNKKLFQYSYSLRKEHTKKIVFTVLFIVFLFTFVNLIVEFLIYPVRQTSTSMIPDIENKSFVMATPLVTKVSRGDVVIVQKKYTEPSAKSQKVLNFLSRFFTAQQFSVFEDNIQNQTIRRVVAVPGDTIYMRDYVMYIKPAGEKHFLTEFEYVKKPYNVTFLAAPALWDNDIGVKGSFETLTLGENEYFLLGDNRKSCEDSRLWGTINRDDIDGKVLFCYFPFRKFRFF